LIIFAEQKNKINTMSKFFEFFIKLFKFIPILWNYRIWDYTLILGTMKASTELMLNSYKKNEASAEDIQELKRFIELLDKHLKDEYFLLATNPNDVKKAVEAEEKDWDELCAIFKGDKLNLKYGIKSWWT
jgi:hypothetical protein